MQPLVSFIGGLAYAPNDCTLWVAGTGEFRQFSQTGTLLTVINPGLGSTSVTGLEVIAPSQVVPEPGTLAYLLSAASLGAGAVLRRRHRAKQPA